MLHPPGSTLFPYTTLFRSGILRRIGFQGRTRVNRHDFGVSWQDELPGGGRAVSDQLEIVLDAEAILESDLEETRSEEHTSELQSHSDLVCRLLLAKTKPQL